MAMMKWISDSDRVELHLKDKYYLHKTVNRNVFAALRKIVRSLIINFALPGGRQERTPIKAILLLIDILLIDDINWPLIFTHLGISC